MRHLDETLRELDEMNVGRDLPSHARASFHAKWIAVKGDLLKLKYALLAAHNAEHPERFIAKKHLKDIYRGR